MTKAGFAGLTAFANLSTIELCLLNFNIQRPGVSLSAPDKIDLRQDYAIFFHVRVALVGSDGEIDPYHAGFSHPMVFRASFA
jgi:hypothetical protein